MHMCGGANPLKSKHHQSSPAMKLHKQATRLQSFASMEYGINLNSQFPGIPHVFSLWPPLNNSATSQDHTPILRWLGNRLQSQPSHRQDSLILVELVAKLHDSGRHDVTYLVAWMLCKKILQWKGCVLTPNSSSNRKWRNLNWQWNWIYLDVICVFGNCPLKISITKRIFELILASTSILHRQKWYKNAWFTNHIKTLMKKWWNMESKLGK